MAAAWRFPSQRRGVDYVVIVCTLETDERKREEELMTSRKPGRSRNEWPVITRHRRGAGPASLPCECAFREEYEKTRPGEKKGRIYKFPSSLYKLEVRCITSARAIHTAATMPSEWGSGAEWGVLRPL